MAPAAESKAAWKKAREKQRGKERRTKEGEGGIEMDGGGREGGKREIRGSAGADHRRLIYNAGDNRIHDQNPAERGH